MPSNKGSIHAGWNTDNDFFYRTSNPAIKIASALKRLRGFTWGRTVYNQDGVQVYYSYSGPISQSQIGRSLQNYLRGLGFRVWVSTFGPTVGDVGTGYAISILPRY